MHSQRGKRQAWRPAAAVFATLCLILPAFSPAKAQESKQETLKPQVQAILVELLKLKRDVLRSLGKTEAEIRQAVRDEAVKKYWAAVDRVVPADGKIPLNDLDRAGVEAILAEVFGEPAPRPPSPDRSKTDSVPPPPSPSGTAAEKSERIAPDFPIIARAVKNEDANLRAEPGITAEARRSRLLQYALGLFARAADVASADPDNLTPSEKAEAARLTDDVIAGKPITAGKAPDSRLTDASLKRLLESLQAKNRRLILAGSDPKSLNHRDQLIEFAKLEAAKEVGGELKASEIVEIDNLADQVRFNAIDSSPKPVPPTSKPAKETLSQEIRDRLLGLARAVNRGLNAVGLDQATRRHILIKFVLEQLARLLGLGAAEAIAADFTPEADSIVNRVLNEPTSVPDPNPPVVAPPPIMPLPIMPQPVWIDPGTVPVSPIRFPGCHGRRLFSPWN